MLTKNLQYEMWHSMVTIRLNNQDLNRTNKLQPPILNILSIKRFSRVEGATHSQILTDFTTFYISQQSLWYLQIVVSVILPSYLTDVSHLPFSEFSQAKLSLFYTNPCNWELGWMISPCRFHNGFKLVTFIHLVYQQNTVHLLHTCMLLHSKIPTCHYNFN